MTQAPSPPPLPAASDTGLVNLHWAQTLADGLAAAGLRDVVLSPGSRSTPLALAFLRHADLACTVVIDERSAAFFALGRAKASQRPVALLCTSGSAPANWHPAVVEAAQGNTPLVLLSADRPTELHGWGANQTTAQTRLFADHVRAAYALDAPTAGFSVAWLLRLAHRLMRESLSPRPGPVHVNIAFREPLLPSPLPTGAPPRPANPPTLPAALAANAVVDHTAAPETFGRLEPIDRPHPREQPGQFDQLAQLDPIDRLAAKLSGRRGIIVCGGGMAPAGLAEAVTALAAALDCPIIAEPLSNLRFGRHDRRRVCVRQESVLRSADGAHSERPDWIIRLGDFPVARRLQEWLAALAPETHVVIAAPGLWIDPHHAASDYLHGDATALCRALTVRIQSPAPAHWCAAFIDANARIDRALERLTEQERVTNGGLWEGLLVPEILDRLPDGFQVFCGASMAVRDLDSFSGGGEKTLQFFANRGVSGIDGNISTAAGLAVERPTLALIGDLTAIHDLGGLAQAKGKPLIVVVINNGGGGIFEYLPAHALPEFERGWLTPEPVNFAHAAATWGIAFRRAETLAEFRHAFNAALTPELSTTPNAPATLAPCLIEVVIDRQFSVERHRHWWQSLASNGEA
ncbi:2-succinyl-5-enolpyruvyl-6-hydroxy-3-cyclohexene-1-carboxylic-acid synthase [Rhodocyclus gracilis]|uniref:2-succinyl-5-enolpyruvyl-6-hydroxy-3-cyclohexene-1-carboxylate synthase n=1 Tax=Rhodocyclus tenuis TaxID=1066 RepID=A0A6L5JSC3_RHOTE|nr:2-succinyl-5-enolpyruvyl-6-hydroxy-3-cyclohexene-1-carboxylic-acid synthase [Rhodocyclus gracilis]MQY50347.1 2-succinyl-5-enolpyruvyl-6-hydroxy-3-cyclohexene-1-carboxylic-acid synthase [Rhodocyclus gracilis]